MGLISRAVQIAAQLIELGWEILDTPVYRRQLPSVALDGEQPIDDGPDDLWPPEPATVPLDNSQQPELHTTRQWGLQLPNGEVFWNDWSGHQLGHPLDRVRLIANLQKTAADIGLAPGEQTDDFLSHYGWVTRNQIASVIYETTGAYPLTHPEVSALDTPVSGETHESDNASAEADRRDQLRGVHTGPVGGDA